MKIWWAFAVVLCAAVSVRAVETRSWQQADMAAFDKGTLTRLSISSDGILSLAPVLKEIYDPSVTFLWAVARDSKGNIYAGGGGLGGSKSKLVMVDAAGKPKVLAELDGLAIQALAVDKQDRVYAATAPDGKVYRVDSAGKVETFYDPHAKYIWALALSSKGDLFVATGDQGEIHRVTPQGAGSLFFRTDEEHARSMVIDAQDNLIVGTDPSGLVMRVNPSGVGFVLYQGAKREITAVAVASDGTVYAAGAGSKQLTPAPAAPAQPAANTAGGIRPATPPPPTLSPNLPAVTGGSEIYRIQPDGYPYRVWTHSQDLVYALAVDSRGHLIAGTGNHGAIYRLDSDRIATRLLNVAPTQVTGFALAPDNRLYAVTGNIGKIFSIGPDIETSGFIESEPFDATGFSYWGRITPVAKGGGTVSFETRSGNLDRPQKNWSPWQKLNNGRIASPAARFIQYRAALSAASGMSPRLEEVDVAYQMKNIAPRVEEIEVTDANYKFPAPAAVSSSSSAATLTLPALGKKPSSSGASSSSDPGTSPSMTFAKGWIGARWLANDDNGDNMTFTIEIRGANETSWKLLKDKIREHYYSWDSTAFPDGKYVLRVTASDSPSNTPEQALSSSMESYTLMIDNTPPEITNLRGAASSGKIDVQFHAKDALNNLDKAEYSINGGDWIIVEPVNRLTDSNEEDYRFQVPAGAGETTVAVRIGDAYDNQAVSKVVVK